jgi:hypothetical protein
MKYQPTQSKPRTHLNIELFFLSIDMGGIEVVELKFEIEFYSLVNLAETAKAINQSGCAQTRKLLHQLFFYFQCEKSVALAPVI